MFPKFRGKVFLIASIIYLSHPRVKSSLKCIKSRYHWPHIDKNVREWAQKCQFSHRQKLYTQNHTKSPFHYFDLPRMGLENIHIDIIGPLPVCKNHNKAYYCPYKYMLMCIDRASRWNEAAPLKVITVISVATALLEVCIKRFGVLLYIITDRGSQFESDCSPSFRQ